MELETFELERQQSLFEHHVDYNLSESGVEPLSLRELAGLGLDLDAFCSVPIEYVQTNGTPELRSQLAGRYDDASPDQLLVTNGTSEANYLAVQVLVRPGDEVVALVPNYLQVAGAARGLGAAVRDVPLVPGADAATWTLDWDAFEAALSPLTRLIYLSQPNNPTGHVFSSAELDRIAAAADRVGAWVLCDEVYRGAVHDLPPGEEAPGCWGRGERIVVTSGLSKSYGLPGARLGWMIGPLDVIARSWARRDYTTIAPGALSDALARFAIRPEVEARLHDRARGMMRVNRGQLCSWIKQQCGVFVYREPRAGAYAFLPYRRDGRPADCVAFVEQLRRKQSVLLVAGRWAGMPGYLRFGLGAEPSVFAAGLARIGEELRSPRDKPTGGVAVAGGAER